MKLSLGNLIGHVFAKDDYKKQLEEKPLTYLVASNGMFETRNNQIGNFTVKTKGFSKLEEVKEGVELNIPKIPFQYFQVMVAWFKTIYAKDKTESTIMLLYHPEEKNFLLFVPEQENSGAASSYKRDDDPELVHLQGSGYILTMVAHSHPWAGTSPPSPSGVDNNDEKEALLYMIVNNVEGTPNVYCSTCPGGTRMPLEFFDLFENPLTNESIDASLMQLMVQYVPIKEVFKRYYDVSTVQIPAEWMKKHKLKSYTYRSALYGASDYDYFSRGKTYGKDDWKSTFKG